MNQKLFFSFVAIISFAISCQNASVAQIEKAQPKIFAQTDQQPSETQETIQQDKTTKIGRCEDRIIHGSFVFTGQVKEIMPYQERLLSQSKYYHPKSGFELQKTIRFAVDKIYGESRKRNGEIKEILADVASSATEPALSFDVGESYLVYATPRYYGKNDYNLKDNLILYPDAFTQPVSQSQERIRSLENLSSPETSRRRHVDNSGEVINSVMRSGKAIKIGVPKYPEQAKGKGIGGTVQVQVLIDEKGNVISATTICAPNELLAPAAEEAALKSAYAPTLFSGKSLRMNSVIVYNFVAQ